MLVVKTTPRLIFSDGYTPGAKTNLGEDSPAFEALPPGQLFDYAGMGVYLKLGAPRPRPNPRDTPYAVVRLHARLGPHAVWGLATRGQFSRVAPVPGTLALHRAPALERGLVSYKALPPGTPFRFWYFPDGGEYVVLAGSQSEPLSAALSLLSFCVVDVHPEQPVYPLSGVLTLGEE